MLCYFKIFRYIGFILCAAVLYCILTDLSWAYNVTLSWDPSPEPHLAGYVLYGKEGSADSFFQYIDIYPLSDLDAGNPSCDVTGLDVNKTYYFSLTAYDTNGVQSEFSNQICIKAGQYCSSSNSIGIGDDGGGGGGCFIATMKDNLPNLFTIVKALVCVIYLLIGWVKGKQFQ